MPSLNKNMEIWNQSYNWKDGGEEWSRFWGSSEKQWYGTLYPRIFKYLPVNNTLEIASGFGRWSQYLLKYSNNLVLIDLSQKCVSACRKRFENNKNVSCFVTNGKSLDVVPDESIDFAFSFDSLVHADEFVIKSYIEELSKKLSPTGVAFIHHSNIGVYKKYFDFLEKSQLYKLQLIAPTVINHYMRDFSMTADKFRGFVEANGMFCISQELINWCYSNKRLIDCLSIFTKNKSLLNIKPLICFNNYFMKEAKAIKTRI